MTEREARKALIGCCRRLYDKGFFPGTDGNISIRAGEDSVFITPSGVSKAITSEEMLVKMSLDGKVLAGGKPSSEAQMHLAAYRRRSGAGAVIHAHSPNIGAFALARRPVDTRYSPFSYYHLGIIGEVPYMAPGTDEFHKAVEEKAAEGFIALMLYGHGSLVIGRDMEDAIAKTDVFEAYAGMLIKAKVLGGAVLLSDEELSLIKHG